MANEILSTGKRLLTVNKGGVGSQITDCDTFFPTANGEVIMGEVNSYSGTQHLPSDLSGYGILETSRLVDGQILIQKITASNFTIYVRTRSYGNGDWNAWTAWKSITLT